MDESCPRTCGTCPTVATTGSNIERDNEDACVDLDDRCAAWTAESKRHCVSSLEFMAGACAKTCGFCGKREDGVEKGASGAAAAKRWCHMSPIAMLALHIFMKNIP